MKERDGGTYWRVIEPIWETVSIYDGPGELARDLARVSVPQRHLFASHWCESEVCNGGFHQFFGNSTGVLSPEAADGFAAIGLLDTSAIVREAMAFFGEPFPRERSVRESFLKRRTGTTRAEWDPFYELDERFYASLRGAGGYQRVADVYAASLPRPGVD